MTVNDNLFIDGQWRPAASGATFAVTDPGNDEHLADVADAGPDDGLAALDAAARAFPSWAATAPRERAEILRRAFELMIERRDDLARLITREMGKSFAESQGEVSYAAEFLRWYSEEAVRCTGDLVTAPAGGYQIMTTLEPVGVCLFITPWNFPAAMATRKLGPALAAGCTAILKPASATPLTALALAQIFRDAGVPAGVVNVVPTSNSSAVTGPLFADRRLRKLSFTGSTEVGRALLAQSAHQVLRTSMELGGNAPFIVLDDADLGTAVASAMAAKLRNIGQSCVAANRFYVHSSRVDEFASRFAAAMEGMTIGYGLDDGVDLGAMITRDARGDVLELIEDAIHRGAELVTGGTVVGDSGAFLRPALLTGVPLDATCMQQEIFGPVAPIASFDSDDEVIALANASDYGLVSYIQTADVARGLSMARAIESGMVGVNRGVVSDPAAPFGGRKQSGLGREGGHQGLMEYLESKYICAAW